MKMKSSKIPYLNEEVRQRALQREKSYLYTIDTEKRHALLFAEYNVSFSVYRTISYLIFRPEGAPPSQIADDLQILRQSMTNIVDTLERQGLAERTADPKDRRRTYVRLLPAGLELGEALLRIEDDYARHIRQHIAVDEINELGRLEEKMHEAKQAALNDILSERKVGK